MKSVDSPPIIAAVREQAAYSTDAGMYQARTRMLHHWRRRAVELLRLRAGTWSSTSGAAPACAST